MFKKIKLFLRYIKYNNYIIVLKIKNLLFFEVI